MNFSFVSNFNSVSLIRNALTGRVSKSLILGADLRILPESDASVSVNFSDNQTGF